MKADLWSITPQSILRKTGELTAARPFPKQRAFPLAPPYKYRAASGDARLRPREDRTDFRVEIKDVPTGPYSLQVGGQTVGVIQVKTLADGSTVILETLFPR